MDLYDLLNAVAAAVVLTYNLLHFKEKKVILGNVSDSAIEYFGSKQQRGIYKILSTVGFWVVMEIVIITAAQHYSGAYFNYALGDLLNTGANYFGMLFFAPLLVLLICLLLKIDPLAQLDLITPAYPVTLIFTKLACFSAGCCRGVAWEHGFYNPVSTLTEFPAQLLESAVALLLFIFLLFCKGKLKKGTVFPVYLMVYSGVRFFTEYLRCEPRIFMGLKTYQILCIAGVLVGVVEYFIVCMYNAHVRKKEKNNHL